MAVVSPGTALAFIGGRVLGVTNFAFASAFLGRGARERGWFAVGWVVTLNGRRVVFDLGNGTLQINQ